MAMQRPVPLQSTPRIDFSEEYSTTAVKGKSALVTGGALGIGGGCSTGLAEAGAYVTIADVNIEAGITLARELTEKGLHVQFVKCDVTSWDDITNAFKFALAFSPDKTIDIVIPNAGIASAGLLSWLNNTQYDSSKPETSTPPPPPQKVIDVNYHAVFNTVHAAIWYFKNFPGSDLSYSKNIVFVSSMGGYNHMPTTACYNSSKWGVRGLFWSLRNVEQLLGEGKPKFRANLIAPTYVSTNMTRGIKERVKESNTPIKVAEVSDVVHVVMRMVSDEEVKGRAAAIAAEKQSFDLCDDPFGVGVGKILNDPEYLKRFGYGRAVRGPETVEETTNGTSQ